MPSLHQGARFATLGAVFVLLPLVPPAVADPQAGEVCQPAFFDGCLGVPVIAMDTASKHTCLLLATGNVVCDAFEGYAGNDALDLATADGHACVLRHAGAVHCWGPGLASGAWTYPNGDAIDVGVAEGKTCILRAELRLICYDTAGRELKLLYNPQQVRAFDVHSTAVCAVVQGSIYCNSLASLPPADYQEGDAVDVAVGRNSYCVLRADGQAVCRKFGGTMEGHSGVPAIGLAATRDAACFVLVTTSLSCRGVDFRYEDLTGVTAVTMDEGRTCVLFIDQSLECFAGSSTVYARARPEDVKLHADAVIHAGSTSAIHVELEVGVDDETPERLQGDSTERYLAAIDAAAEGNAGPLIAEVLALQRGPPPVLDEIYGSGGIVRLQSSRHEDTRPGCVGIEERRGSFRRPVEFCSPFVP